MREWAARHSCFADTRNKKSNKTTTKPLHSKYLFAPQNNQNRLHLIKLKNYRKLFSKRKWLPSIINTLFFMKHSNHYRNRNNTKYLFKPFENRKQTKQLIWSMIMSSLDNRLCSHFRWVCLEWQRNKHTFLLCVYFIIHLTHFILC